MNPAKAWQWHPEKSQQRLVGKKISKALSLWHQTVVICLNKSPYSYWNWQQVWTTVHSHFQAVLFISILQQSNESPDPVQQFLFQLDWAVTTQIRRHTTGVMAARFEAAGKLSQRAADGERILLFFSPLASLGTSCRNLSQVILHANSTQHTGVVWKSELCQNLHLLTSQVI